MTASKSIIIFIAIIVVNFDFHIEATSYVEYCHNYTRCFDEMMNEQEQCSAISNKQQQQSIIGEYHKLRYLIAKRKEYFANCIMNEANKTTEESNCKSDNITITSIDNINKKPTILDKNCWKNIRIIRNRCTIIEQCCPFIQICQEKTESSDEAKAVNDQHQIIIKQLKHLTNSNNTQTLSVNNTHGGYRKKVLAERLFQKMTINNTSSTDIIESNIQNITTTTTLSSMIMTTNRQLTNSTKLIKRRRNLKKTIQSRKIDGISGDKLTNTQIVGTSHQQLSSNSQIDALEIINELRKISAKVGNDDDERAKVLNGAAELIAMVEIGNRNKSKLLPSNGQSIKSVENATEMISTNIPFDAHYRKQQTVFSRSINDRTNNNVIGNYSKLDSNDYCQQYAQCLHELQFESKKCSWNHHQSDDGNNSSSRIVPGLPRRRNSSCQRVLSTEYARLNALIQVQQAFVPRCLQQNNIINDKLVNIDINQPEYPMCYDVVKPKLPDYDDDQQKCLHGVRILRNYCRSFRRCCPKADYCHQAELDSDDYKAVQLQRHDLVRKSADCQISANKRYSRFRLQTFNNQRVKSNRIIRDSVNSTMKIIQLLNYQKLSSLSPIKNVANIDDNLSTESDSSRLSSIKPAPFDIVNNNNNNNYYTAPNLAPIAKIPPVLT